MDIFVQSRGFEPNKDYTWLNIKSHSESQKSKPPISNKTASLIQGDSPSIALERLSDQRLLLLVTAIETENRFDFHDRQIRISAIWIVPPSEEKTMRRFVARLLSVNGFETLTQQLDQAVLLLREPEEYKVKSECREQVNLALQNYSTNLGMDGATIRSFANGQPLDYKKFIIICQNLSLDWRTIKDNADNPKSLEYGFDANFQDLELIYLTYPTNELMENALPNLNRKIGCNSPELREKLAQELRRCKLPDDNGPLVIVTGFKKKASLEQSGVWRSLSTLVKASDWEEVQEQDYSQSGRNFLTVPISEIFQRLSQWLDF